MIHLTLMEGWLGEARSRWGREFHRDGPGSQNVAALPDGVLSFGGERRPGGTAAGKWGAVGRGSSQPTRRLRVTRPGAE